MPPETGGMTTACEGQTVKLIRNSTVNFKRRQAEVC